MNTPTNRQTEEFLTIQEFWQLCRSHLDWFLVSLTLTLSMAAYYLVSTPDMYTCEAAVLVKMETTGTMVAQKQNGSEFNNMALVQQPTSVPNVLRQYTSLAFLSDVANRLNPASDSGGALSKAGAIRSRLTVTQDNEQSTVINLKYVDYSPRLAEQVLSTILEAFNERWLAEKNQMARSTARFIDDRLLLIEKDLNAVDDSISTFKMHHQITNLERVSDLYLQQQNESEADMLKLTNQMAMAQYILDILQDKSTQHQLLPANTGLALPEVETQISVYNTQLLRLKNNLVGTTSQNPIILRQENEIDDLRQNIVATVTNQIKSLQMQLTTVTRYNEEAKEKVTSSPDQAKRLLSVERDQKVKESLYLYLLQKKEENEISMTYTPVPTQILDMPHGSPFPSFPNKNSILMAATLAGLLIPMVILFVIVSLDTTVRSKADIESRTILPVVGEVPFYTPRKYRAWMAKRILFRKIKDTPTPLVVRHGSQDVVNEAFRVIRSNLEFMSDTPRHENIYIITSMYSGSGKTFICINLALTLAIKGRRVLIIDGDMRRSSASRTFGNREVGLADFLGEKVHTVDDIIYQNEHYPSLHILPVGTTPPNPTELLSSPRLREMLEELRPCYDFILIDCPMMEVLADASIIEHLADRTLYIVRAGLFQRKMVSQLETNTQAGKYKNLSIILNAVPPIGRYGYKYGYKYGYYYNYKQ